MKKIISFVTVFSMVTITMAQCVISGKSTINSDEAATYTIESDNAQCTDCHLWVTVGGNSQIEGDFRKNTVKLKPLSGGRTVLSLSVLSSQGFSQCTKNIDIVDRNSSSQITGNQPQNVDCDINVSSFKEVKYAEGIVSYFPSNTENSYKYTWTAIYANGEQKTSTEKIPQFPYTKESSITTVKLKIVSSQCMKDLSKSYDSSYWKFF